MDQAFQQALYESYSSAMGGYQPRHSSSSSSSSGLSHSRSSSSSHSSSASTQPVYGRRSAGAAAGIRTATDLSTYSTGTAPRPIRNTLARDGIMPRMPSRTTSLDHNNNSIDITASSTVPAHTLESVAAPKLIKGVARESPSASRSRRTLSSSMSSSDVSDAKRSQSSSSASSSSGAIGGKWVRTNEGLGRARWDQAHGEIKIEGTSNSLFVAVQDEGRNQGICQTSDWVVTCEVKATGAAYLLFFLQYERFTSAADLSAISTTPNSEQLSFLAVCCNTASKTWSLELKKPSASRTANPSLLLATVKDQTLLANKFYHCSIALQQGNRLTLLVDGHKFFDRVLLPQLEPSQPFGGPLSPSAASSATFKLPGRSFGIGVVRSKAHLRNFFVRELAPNEQFNPATSAKSTSTSKPVPNVQPYTSTSVAYANGQPVGAHAGVSDRTASVFGSSEGNNRPSSTSQSSSGSATYHSSPSVSPPATALQQMSIHDETPVPRSAYSASMNGDDPKLIEMIEHSIINHDLGISLDDIASLTEAKHMLREAVIMPLILPEFFQGIRQPSKGILLHGPPGTGKTMLAKAIANVSEVTFFNVNSSVLTSKWRGESEKLVTTLFNMARYYAPAIIFFDEIDALLMSRGGSSEHEASRAFKATMLSQIDGLLSAPTSNGAETKLVMLLATSNCPWDLDPAIRRRLEKRLYIPLPDETSRYGMLKLYLKDIKLAEDVDLKLLSELTDGYSGADMIVICRDASMAPFRRLIAGKTPAEIRQLKATPEALQFSIDQKDFMDALQRVQPSVDRGMVEKFENWQKEFGSGI